MSEWPVERIDDHADRAADRIVSQYRDAQRFEQLIRLAADQYQELEGVFWKLLTERGIDTAVGAQLDGLGEIVGEPRLGRNDDAYRAAIQVRITLNRAAGEPELVIAFIIGLTDATEVQWKEIYPAKVQIFVDAAISLAEAQRIRQLLPAAVGSAFIESAAGVRPFGVTGIDETSYPDALGFGELGMHDVELSDGDLLELSDGDTLAIMDVEDPILPVDGGALAELYEV